MRPTTALKQPLKGKSTQSHSLFLIHEEIMMNFIERKRRQLDQLFRSFIMQWRAIQRVSWGCGNWEGNVVWNCATSNTQSLTASHKFDENFQEVCCYVICSFLILTRRNDVSLVPFSVEHSIWWREYQSRTIVKRIFVIWSWKALQRKRQPAWSGCWVFQCGTSLSKLFQICEIS